MDLATKLDLIKRLPTEEIITEPELVELLQTKIHPVAYNGFEPSGLAHLGTGLITALKVRDFVEAGFKFILFIADWHASVNMKLGGDLQKIRKAGQYLIHAWRSLGVEEPSVKFVYGSEVYDQDYWKLVLKVALHMNLSDVRSALPIAGRKAMENLPFGSYIYIPMQVADIFHLGVDVCQLGIDQRKANVLAREIGPKIGKWKPVAVHHHLLMGLQGPRKMGFEEDEALDVRISSKMSKSKPGSIISIHDKPEIIELKLREAFCPPRSVENNSVFEIVRYILMRDGKTPFVLIKERERDVVTYESYDQLAQDYVSGKIHPLDLKISVARALSKILEPSRRYFLSNSEARQLLEFMISETGYDPSYVFD